MTRKELAAQYAAKQKDVKALTDQGLDNLTEEQAASLGTLLDERDAIKAQLDAFPKDSDVKGRVAAGDAFLSTPVPPAPHPGSTREPEASADGGGEVKALVSEVDKLILTGGYESLGHFAHAQYKAREGGYSDYAEKRARYHGAIKARNAGLIQAAGGDVKAATGLLEASDSEGGEFVPVQYAQGIWQRSIGQPENLWNRLNPIPVMGNSLSISAYADDSRVDGQRMGGVQGYWTAEAAQYTKSKPATRKIHLRLNKLTVLVWATEELLEDSAMALDSEINRLASDEITFKLNDALVRGTGAGMPQGFLNSAAKITQAAVSAQGANTLTARNVDDMWARRSHPTAASFVWIANQDCEGQMAQFNYSMGTTAVAATWLYLPAGGITGTPTPMLKGRPVIFIEQAESLGTEGDLSLVNLDDYAAIVKSSGIKQAISMHLRFDYDEVAFKFSFRADARPRWEKPLTRFKGANTLSPIVTLNSTRT